MIVNRIKQKLNLKTYKCISVTKYLSEDQKKRAKTYYRDVYRKSLNKKLIIGDETYVTNVPQARPIERFWFLCKNQYKE